MKKENFTRRKFFKTTGFATAGLATSCKDLTSAPAVMKKHDVLESVDVLVVGGGPAGIGAALGTARKAASTMIIESQSFFGGVAAWSLGMNINQIRPTGLARSEIHKQFISKIAAYGDQAIRFGKHQIWCNVEYMKVAVLDALEESGCRYLLHAGVVDAVVENNRVTGVIIGTKRGLKRDPGKSCGGLYWGCGCGLFCRG